MLVFQKRHPAGDRVLALGTFDGVHRGHRSLLLSAARYASGLGIPLRVCTFNRHPLDVLCPGNSPPMLSTIPEKARLMSDAGVDEMELIPFDRSTADMEPEAFLDMLRQSVNIRAVAAGWNYSFGRGGRGNTELLEADGRKHGYTVLTEPPAKLADGTVISSSQVREALNAGETERAEELLGYRYTLTGTVSEGKHEGHKLGYPTANIVPWKRKAFPKFGVYTCLLETAGSETRLPGIVNIGVQPTLPSGKVTMEAHILRGNPDLYGEKVRLTLIGRLRDEQRFPSVDALKDQIGKDREAALKAFDMA